MEVKLEKAALALALALAASPLIAWLTGLWEPYWVLVTNLGEETAYIAMAVLLYALASPELGFRTLLALALGGWANVLLKNALRMPRPPRELWKIEVSGYGFPSGHAQTSTSFWSAIAMEARNAYVALLGAVVVALVSYSRLELGVHYPHDVLGGIALGLLSASAALALARLSQRSGAPVQAASLVLLGSLAALAYAVQGDVMLVRTGGVIAGSAAHPLLRRWGRREAGIKERVASALGALAVAYAITRLAASAHPLLQFLAYAAAVAAAMLLVAGLAARGGKEENLSK